MSKQDEQKRQYTVTSLTMTESERLAAVLEHFAENRAFTSHPDRDSNPELLQIMKNRYAEYRRNWRSLPEEIIKNSQETGQLTINHPPMCVDIEVAAICDLACPFCYRQHIATPDKLMDGELYRAIINQCAEMGVPSVKLTLRGEPLLHPALPEFIAYAKEKGILEVLINTNAVSLSAAKAKAIIEAGIDVVIFSFDGGTEQTYNRMRPGRFKENDFNSVYRNIRTFAEIKTASGKFFPRTRIQMIVTEETAGEVDNFLKLFAGIVDDVSTKAYSERGGDVITFRPQLKEAIKKHFAAKQEPLAEVDPKKIWLTGKDQVMYATGRLPCQQIFQRLVVNYDGRVQMCCYDWGCRHTIGFLSGKSFTARDKDLLEVMEKVKNGANGFERLRGMVIPDPTFEPPHTVQTLKEIWHGSHLNEIRRMHLLNRTHEIELCRECNFRDTYKWEKINS